jgi:hypothetical protein
MDSRTRARKYSRTEGEAGWLETAQTELRPSGTWMAHHHTEAIFQAARRRRRTVPLLTEKLTPKLSSRVG